MKFTFNIDISWKIWYIFHRAVSRFCKRPLQSTSEICKKRKGNQAMQKLKRLLALGAAAMMLVGSASLPVYATPTNNHTNSQWGITINPGSVYSITKLREKVDASGIYVFYDDGTVSSLACDVLNPAGVSQCRKIGSIKKGQKGLIAQYVYENGYDQCKLMVSTSVHDDGGGYGWWSPDSIGYYPYINL